MLLSLGLYSVLEIFELQHWFNATQDHIMKYQLQFPKLQKNIHKRRKMYMSHNSDSWAKSLSFFFFFFFFTTNYVFKNWWSQNQLFQKVGGTCPYRRQWKWHLSMLWSYITLYQSYSPSKASHHVHDEPHGLRDSHREGVAAGPSLCPNNLTICDKVSSYNWYYLFKWLPS